jgi:hypothetical protein
MMIRPQQMDALNSAAMAVFEGRLADYVRQVFPKEAHALTEQDLRKRINACTQKGRSYGLVSELAYARFAHVSFLLGPEFDRDPTHEWAGRLLREDIQDPDRVMGYVFEVALEKSRDYTG